MLVISWQKPPRLSLPGTLPSPRLYNRVSGDHEPISIDDSFRLYVCGITPYDATHIGHAATYLTFDLLLRVAIDAGLEATYAQNITDVDDPLLERAAQTSIDWRELAEQQVELYRNDMEYLSVIPPESFLGVTEQIEQIASAVDRLVALGFAYPVAMQASEGAEEHGYDIYFDMAKADRSEIPWHTGIPSRYSADEMLRFFRERGGDPDREGKRGQLDPLLWRAARPREPRWAVTGLPAGRPGWHIECSVIATGALGNRFDVQGGGSDLIFPHHEMSAAHAAALTNEPMARLFSHAGMVAYQGSKMSKSLGNLVFVSTLRRDGASADALRLAIFSHHYRTDWEWTDDLMPQAEQRLKRWREAYERSREATTTEPADRQPVGGDWLLSRLRDALAHDLDTPAGLAAVDSWAQSPAPGSGDLVAKTLTSLLGINLLSGPSPATGG